MFPGLLILPTSEGFIRFVIFHEFCSRKLVSVQTSNLQLSTFGRCISIRGHQHRELTLTLSSDSFRLGCDSALNRSSLAFGATTSQTARQPCGACFLHFWRLSSVVLSHDVFRQNF